MYLEMPFAKMTALSDEAYVTAVYLLTGKSSAELMLSSGQFATGQTIGTWVDVPGISEEMRRRFLARVTGVYDIGILESGTEAAVLCVAFPLENIASSFAMLQTAMMGNDVSTSLQLRLLDLQFTPRALQHYPGPQKGVAGVREATGVYDRPLVLNMIKPSLGHTPEVGAKIFFETAMGGVDMIKDDEVLGCISVSTAAQRAEIYGKAAEKVQRETGKLPLYIPNITDTPSAMRRHCRDILSAGGRAVMVNFMATGYDALQEISQEFGRKLIVMGHYAGVSAVSSPGAGYADSVAIGLLPRLAGADIIMTMYPGRPGSSGYLSYLQTAQSQQLPMPGILPTLTAVGGGITPFNMGDVVTDLGKDTILGVGGAIQGHPLGATSGA